MKVDNDPEILALPVMDEDTAWEWCMENSYEALLERSVEDLMEVLPEDIQQQIFEWEGNNLYAVLLFSGKIRDSPLEARNYNKRPARPTGKARW